MLRFFGDPLMSFMSEFLHWMLIQAISTAMPSWCIRAWRIKSEWKLHGILKHSIQDLNNSVYSLEPSSDFAVNMQPHFLLLFWVLYASALWDTFGSVIGRMESWDVRKWWRTIWLWRMEVETIISSWGQRSAWMLAAKWMDCSSQFSRCVIKMDNMHWWDTDGGIYGLCYAKTQGLWQISSRQNVICATLLIGHE